MNPTKTAEFNSPHQSALPTVISRYFETFKTEDFELTASLFAEDGALRPPFEAAVMGREAIASYLNKEAKGIKLNPLECSSPSLKDGNTEYTVFGEVRTPLFSVNINWLFILNPSLEIVLTKIILTKPPKQLKLEKNPFLPHIN
ncbi:ketosteroid isomerase family protein [Merismopedia glauca]|uniref:Nuclear transport factor 2 n=1 Tax=Merismopedia glauca CCAP 1448/3 TaxID=1296344 RepID=A0A2T1C3V2_9CYAN|nr:ketosteroid isomerase family protein [Merismopedia glauca]PSB02936.1 nuclear transport factor 2 [Merismopedia glauca CCAP 1448/3]